MMNTTRAHTALEVEHIDDLPQGTVVHQNTLCNRGRSFVGLLLRAERYEPSLSWVGFLGGPSDLVPGRGRTPTSYTSRTGLLGVLRRGLVVLHGRRARISLPSPD